MDSKVFWALAAFAFALLFGFLPYLLLAPSGISIAWAAVIGIATFPACERILKRFAKGKRPIDRFPPAGGTLRSR